MLQKILKTRRNWQIYKSAEPQIPKNKTKPHSLSTIPQNKKLIQQTQGNKSIHLEIFKLISINSETEDEIKTIYFLMNDNENTI